MKKEKKNGRRKECPKCGCLYDEEALRFKRCLKCNTKLIWEKPIDKDYLK